MVHRESPEPQNREGVGRPGREVWGWTGLLRARDGDSAAETEPPGGANLCAGQLRAKPALAPVTSWVRKPLFMG